MWIYYKYIPYCTRKTLELHKDYSYSSSHTVKFGQDRRDDTMIIGQDRTFL